MTSALAGKRILVVEDEYFIASDLRRALQKAGAVPVGPVGDLAAGLSLVDRQPIDAALLDINLEEATSYRIADRLDAQSTPYVFLTGYDGPALPRPYRHAPRVSKPYAVDQVLGALERAVGAEVRS